MLKVIVKSEGINVADLAMDWRWVHFTYCISQIKALVLNYFIPERLKPAIYFPKTYLRQCLIEMVKLLLDYNGSTCFKYNDNKNLPFCYFNFSMT